MSSQKVLVAGTGISGIAAAKLLLAMGGEVVLYDGNEKLDEEALKAKFEDSQNVSVVLGELKRTDLLGVELCIISPGIPLEAPFVAVIDEAKIPIWGEIQLAYHCAKGRLAAITGTNGKTTTTALTGQIMKDYFDSVFVVGNIGIPYTQIALDTQEDSVTVAEVSSFQLETIMDFHPQVSAILNITPDHLNRHGTMERYIEMKKSVALNQTEEDTIVLNYDDPVLRSFGLKEKEGEDEAEKAAAGKAEAENAGKAEAVSGTAEAEIASKTEAVSGTAEMTAAAEITGKDGASAAEAENTGTAEASAENQAAEKKEQPDNGCLEIELKAKVIFFSSRNHLEEGLYLDGDEIIWRQNGRQQVVVNVHDLKLLGRHNYENVMAAVAIGLTMGVPLESIRKTIVAFQAVEHRIEFVAERYGVKYYNDSKGTNPDAAIQAVRAMPGPTLLIAGGYDKQNEYDEWIESFDGKVKYMVLIGQTRDKIAQCAREHGFHEIMYAEDMQEAVRVCASYANRGENVLLSPACASWGMFKNYEERGRIFKECVLSL
ncbi:MAG: Mur ligase family protein [Lachnospiraceae bacterium]|nr:Mur ligase family protein [Lachnospiraceae bacterium]